MKLMFHLLLILVFTNSHSQTATYHTVFSPESRTYNGSPDPKQCWESVDDGIIINVGSAAYFFLIPAREFQVLCKTLLNKVVTVDVIYFDTATPGSGAAGNVVKITCDNSVVFGA